MQQIDTLTDDADQILTMTLEDGSNLKMEFIYRPGIQRWAVNITHALVVLVGYEISLSPNILRPWKNLIPFGIAVISTDGLDPVQVSDFISGRVSVFVLSQAEVLQVESEILAPIPLMNT